MRSRDPDSPDESALRRVVVDVTADGVLVDGRPVDVTGLPSRAWRLAGVAAAVDVATAADAPVLAVVTEGGRTVEQVLEPDGAIDHDELGEGTTAVVPVADAAAEPADVEPDAAEPEAADQAGDETGDGAGGAVFGGVVPARRRWTDRLPGVARVPLRPVAAALVVFLLVGGVMAWVGLTRTSDDPIANAGGTQTPAASEPSTTVAPTPAPTTPAAPDPAPVRAIVAVDGGTGTLRTRFSAPRRVVVRWVLYGPAGRVLEDAALELGPRPTVRLREDMAPGRYRWVISPFGGSSDATTLAERLAGATDVRRPPEEPVAPVEEPTTDPTTPPDTTQPGPTQPGDGPDGPRQPIDPDEPDDDPPPTPIG